MFCTERATSALLHNVLVARHPCSPGRTRFVFTRSLHGVGICFYWTPSYFSVIFFTTMNFTNFKMQISLSVCIQQNDEMKQKRTKLFKVAGKRIQVMKTNIEYKKQK